MVTDRDYFNVLRKALLQFFQFRFNTLDSLAAFAP